MLSFSDLDRICTATLAGAFRVRIIQPDTFNQIEFRRLRAGAANTSRTSGGLTAAGRGFEQGKK
jgi:hypothetical protein